MLRAIAHGVGWFLKALPRLIAVALFVLTCQAVAWIWAFSYHQLVLPDAKGSAVGLVPDEAIPANAKILSIEAQFAPSRPFFVWVLKGILSEAVQVTVLYQEPGRDPAVFDESFYIACTPVKHWYVIPERCLMPYELFRVDMCSPNATKPDQCAEEYLRGQIIPHQTIVRRPPNIPPPPPQDHLRRFPPSRLPGQTVS